MGAVATKTTTWTIGPKQAARAFHAVRFATDIGRPLNFAITVDTSTLGIPEEDAGAFLQVVWARVTRWWAYQRHAKGRKLGPFDAFLIHENPDEGPRHAHWFIRVPKSARGEVEKLIVSRIEKLTGLDDLGDAVHFLDVHTPGDFAKYMNKGLDPHYGPHFYVNTSDQGEIIGRRMTISHSIGYTARKNEGWTPAHSRKLRQNKRRTKKKK